MITATVKGNDIVWENPSGVLAVLKDYNTSNHRLEIQDEDTFDIERTLANMDDTYDQTTWKKFFPVSIDPASGIYERIRSIIQGRYVDGAKEREWRDEQLSVLAKALKDAKKIRIKKVEQPMGIPNYSAYGTVKV